MTTKYEIRPAASVNPGCCGAVCNLHRSEPRRKGGGFAVGSQKGEFKILPAQNRLIATFNPLIT